MRKPSDQNLNRSNTQKNNGTNKTNSTSTPVIKSQRNISLVRGLLLVTLILAGGLIGGFSYYSIRKHQYQLIEEDFERSTRDHYQSLKVLLNAQTHLNIQLTTTIGLECPEESNWPNCALPSKEITALTHSLLAISQINQFVFSPIVTPSNRISFEAFAKNYYETDGSYPNTTGYSDFGFGIYDFAPNLTHVKTPNHTDPTVSKRDIMTPILLVSDIPRSKFLLSNSYANPLIKNTLDNILDCVNTSTSIDDEIIDIPYHCSTTTDRTPNRVIEYSGISVSPVFPENSPSTPVGFIGAVFSWRAAISAALQKQFNFQCTIHSTTSVESGHHYQIKNGEAYEIEEINNSDDYSDHLFSSSILKKKYTIEVEGMFTSATVYTITYFSSSESPSDLFAILACVSCVFVTLLISVIFVCFNILINREASAASMLLDSKRTYVRFISHEIRTPLNSIILSIRLLEENLKKVHDISQTMNEKEKEKEKEKERDEKERDEKRNADLPDINSIPLSDILEESFELISELQENSSIAVMTLNDLINYDKIETKSFSIEEKDVNIWSVIEKTIKPLTYQAKEKNIRMELSSQLLTPSRFPETQFPLQNLRLIGDSMKLGQVIRNLVSNALKFTPNDGEVKITASFQSIEFPQYQHQASSSQSRVHPSTDLANVPVGHVVIVITDTGPGLSPEQLQGMFCQGVQFNPNELQAGQGSGLGLWISKEIVSLHKGHINVTSAGIGCGSTFEVILPVVLRDLPIGSPREHNFTSKSTRKVLEETSRRFFPSSGGNYPPDNSNNSNVESSSSPSPSSPPCVLVVDDTPSNRKLVSRLLKSRGFVCHEAENGQECVDKITSGTIPFDFILMDYEMPIMDGPTAARTLRDLKYEILIIGLTGNVLPEDREYFIQQGANVVLTKPLNLDEFLDYYQNYQKKIKPIQV